MKRSDFVARLVLHALNNAPIYKDFAHARQYHQDQTRAADVSATLFVEFGGVFEEEGPAVTRTKDLQLVSRAYFEELLEAIDARPADNDDESTRAWAMGVLRARGAFG